MVLAALGKVSPAVRRGDPAPLLRAAEAAPGVLCPVLGPWYETDLDILERVPQSTTKMKKGLEHASHKERLRELGLFSLEKKTRGSYPCLQIPVGTGMRK